MGPGGSGSSDGRQCVKEERITGENTFRPKLWVERDTTMSVSLDTHIPLVPASHQAARPAKGLDSSRL